MKKSRQEDEHYPYVMKAFSFGKLFRKLGTFKEAKDTVEQLQGKCSTTTSIENLRKLRNKKKSVEHRGSKLGPYQHMNTLPV